MKTPPLRIHGKDCIVDPLDFVPLIPGINWPPPAPISAPPRYYTIERATIGK